MNIKKSNLKEKLKPNPAVNSANKKPPSDSTKFSKHQSEKGKLRKEESDYFKSKLKAIEKNDREKSKKQNNELLDSKKNEIIYYDPSYTPKENLYQGKVSQTLIDPVNYQQFKRSISPKLGSNIDLIGKKENDLLPEVNPADPRNLNFNTLKVGKKPPQGSTSKFNPPPIQPKNDDIFSISSHRQQKTPIFSPGNYQTNPKEIINYKNERSPESIFLYRSHDESIQENEKDQKTFKTRSEIDDNQRASQINNLYRNSIMNNMLHSQQILNQKKSVNDFQYPLDTNNHQLDDKAMTNFKALKRKVSSAFAKNMNDGNLLASVVTYGPTKTKHQTPNIHDGDKSKKLSTLLLSKSAEPQKRSHSNTPEDKYRTPDLSPKHTDHLTKKNNNYFGTINSNKTRFIKLTLALIHGKGLNTEDRIITRDMRAEKGGVVDFAQNQKKQVKPQYQIKNIIANKSPSGKNKKIKLYSYKDRERSAKLIQKWWRDFLDSYNILKDKIVRIQSNLRGFLVRKSLSDILYIEIFGRNLSDKLYLPITRCIRRYVFANLAHEYIGENTKHRIIMDKIKKIQRKVKRYLFRKHSFPLENALVSNNRKNNNNSLIHYFNLWKSKEFEIKKAEIMQRGKNKTREFLIKKIVLNPKGKEYLHTRKAFKIWKKHYENYVLYNHFMKWFKPEVHVKHMLLSNYSKQNNKSIIQGNERLKKVFKKKYFLNPLVKAFKLKKEKEELKRAFLKSDNLQTTLIKKGVRKCFIRWRRSCIMRKTLFIKQDKPQFFYSKLLGKIVDLISKLINKRFLARRFYQWKNKGFQSESDIKTKRLFQATNSFIKKNLLYFVKKRFYEKLIKYRSKRYKSKCLRQVFNKKSNKHLRFIRKRFNLWRYIVNPSSNKHKFLRQNIIRNNLIYKLRLLNSYFYKWRNVFSKNNLDRKLNIDDPENIYLNTAKRNAFSNMKDDKVKVSINRYSNKKRIEKFFIHWWKISKKEEELKLKKLCKRMNLNNIKKILLKSGNQLERYFKLWIKSLIPLNSKENLRKKMKKACEKLNNGIYKKNIDKNAEFFEKLNEKVSTQYTERQFFNKLLPQCSKLTEKVKNNHMARAFRKWKKLFEKYDVMKLQFKFLHNLKNHKLMNLLRKKFIQWKTNKPINSKVYPNTIRGMDILSETLHKNQGPELLHKLHRNAETKKRQSLIRNILDKNNTDSNDLKQSFIKWWKYQLQHEKNCLIKTCKEIKLRNLKKFILSNKPLHRYFKRWIVNIIEIKRDDTIKNKEALSKLKNAIKSNVNQEIFPIIKNHISPSHLIKTFTKNIIPLCKNLQEREETSSLRYYYNRWRKKIVVAREKKMKIKLLSNMKAYDQMGMIRKAFNLWRYNNLQLKNKMYEKTVPKVIKATEQLQNTMKKNVAPYLLDQLQSNRDHKNKMDYLKNQLKHKLKSHRFILKSYFMKWWKDKLNFHQNQFNDVQNKIKDLYMKNLKKSIMKINKFSLEQYFRKWLRKSLTFNQDKKSLDLFKLFNRIKRVYTRINGRDFLELIKNHVSPVYLKKEIVKKLNPTCKVLNERLITGNVRKYFQLWKKVNYNTNLKNTQFKLLYKLKAKNLKDDLRNKLNLWRKINSKLNKKVKSNIPILVELLKRTANRKPYEELKDVYTQGKINELRDNIFCKKLNRDGKLYNKFLRKCFLKWKELMKDFLLKDFKGHIMKGKLKDFTKNRNVPKLLKAFKAWAHEEPYIGEDDEKKTEKLKKIREKRRKNNMMPYIIGEQILKKLLQRKALELLKKRTELLNLKVPNDFSLKQALLKGTKGISKNISIKILFLRHFYNRWKKCSEAIETQELKNDVVNNLFSKCNFMYLLPLRNCFKKWKNKITDLNKKSLQNDFKANIYKMLYGKYGKKFLREKFNFWREKIANYKRKLEKIVKATNKLNKKYRRENFNNLRKRIENKKIYEIQKAICSRVLKRLIKASHQGKMLYYFCFWRKYTRMCRENQYKYFILKSLINRQTKNSNLIDRNFMKEILLKWKINSTPKHIIEKILNNRKGIEILKRNLRRIFCRNPYNKLKEKMIANQAVQAFRKQIRNQFIKLKDDTLKKKFDHLRKMVIDRKLMQKKLRNWFDRLIIVKNKELISDTANELIDIMKYLYSNKNRKAKIIQEQFRSLKKKKKEEKLFNTLENTNKRNVILLRGYFNQFKIKGQQFNTFEKAMILQSYFRSILNHVKKENSAEKLSSLLRNHFKKQVRDLIKQCYNNDRCQMMYNVMKKRLLRDPFRKIRKEAAIKKFGKFRNKFISKFFKKRHVIFLVFFFEKFKKNTISQVLTKCKTLQNKYKSKYVKKKQETVIKKDKVAKQLFKNFFSKYSDKLILKFLKWKRIYKIWLFNEKAKEIQHAFRYMKFRKVLFDVTQFNKFRNLFKRSFKKTLTDILKDLDEYKSQTCSNFEKMKGELEKRLALNNSLNLANDKIRNTILRKALENRVDNKANVQKYYLRWKDVVSSLNSRANKLQNKYRKYLAQKKLEKLLFVKRMLLKFVSSYENTKHYKKAYFFANYRNSVKNIVIKENVRKIENFLYLGLVHEKIKIIRYNFCDLATKRLIYLMRNIALLNTFKYKLLKKPRQEVIKALETKKLCDVAIKSLKLNLFKREGVVVKELLRNYLNKWKEHAILLKQRQIKALKSILGAYNKYIFKKKVLVKARKIQKPERLVNVLIHKNQTQMKVLFVQWKNNCLKEKLNDNATILTRYMRKIYNKINDYRRASNFINKYGAIHILMNVYNLYRTRQAFSDIKDFRKNKAFAHYLKKLVDLNKSKMKEAFKRIKSCRKYNYSDYLDKIVFIQKHYKKYTVRKNILTIFELIRRLRYILSLMADRNKMRMNKAFKFWKWVSYCQSLNDSARIIQDFTYNNVLLRNRRKRVEKLENMRNMFHFYYDKIIVFKGAKDTLRIHNFTKASVHLKRYVFRKFMRNINHFEALKYINKIFRLPVRMQHRLLRKYVELWKANAKYLDEKRASNLIKKNFRLYKNRRNKEEKLSKVKKVLKLTYLKYHDMRSTYFSKWKRISCFFNIVNAKDVISTYFRNKLDSLKCTRKWIRLGKMLKPLVMKKEKINCLGKFKQYCLVFKLNEIFNKILKKRAFENIKGKDARIRIIRGLASEVNKYEGKKNLSNLNKYWKRWVVRLKQIKHKEMTLGNFVYLLDKLRKINAANYLNNAFTVKKFFSFKRAVEKEFYFRKLKHYGEKLKDCLRLRDMIKMSRDNLIQQNKQFLSRNIYKIYTYKILSKLHKGLDKLRLINQKSAFDDLLLGLKQRMIECSSYSDKRDIKGLVNKKLLKLKFNRSTVGKNKSKETEKGHNKSSKEVFMYLTPYFTNYLMKIILIRKQETFDSIKDNYKIKSLVRLLSKACINKLEVNKNIAFNRIYNKKSNDLLKAHFMKHTRILFRKYLISLFNIELKPVSRLFKLNNLINITLIHKEICDDRFNSECISRWKVYAHMNRIAKEKIQSLYKSIKTSYQNVAQEIFGDNENKPGMIKEFGNFGEKSLVVSSKKIKEKYFNKIGRRYSDVPITDQNFEEVKEQTPHSPKLKPRRLELDNLDDKLKDSLDFEVIHTEPMFSNKSIFSEISFKTIDSGNTENQSSISSRKEHKIPTSNKLSDTKKNKVPSTVTNRKSSVAGTKDNKKYETISYSNKKPSGVNKKADPIVKKK